MKEKDTLLDHLTRATIEANVFLTETQLENIAKDLALEKSSCCRDSYKDRKNSKGHFPFCYYTCDKCGNPCTIRPDITVTK